MIPSVYTYPKQINGDTVPLKTFNLLDNGNPIDLTGASIKAQFRNVFSGPTIKTMQIGSGITVPSPTLGSFNIDEFLLDWGAGRYLYDIQITFPDSTIKTYVTGSIDVVADITK